MRSNILKSQMTCFQILVQYMDSLLYGYLLYEHSSSKWPLKSPFFFLHQSAMQTLSAVPSIMSSAAKMFTQPHGGIGWYKNVHTATWWHRVVQKCPPSPLTVTHTTSVVFLCSGLNTVHSVHFQWFIE